jgi:hypothetical protein
MTDHLQLSPRDEARRDFAKARSRYMAAVLDLSWLCNPQARFELLLSISLLETAHAAMLRAEPT